MYDIFDCNPEYESVKHIADPNEQAERFWGLVQQHGKLAHAFQAAWRDITGYIAKAFPNLTPQDWEDINQETALAVWLHLPEYRPSKASWTTWCIAIARNFALMRLRGLAREADMPEQATAAEPDDDAVEYLQTICTILRQWQHKRAPYPQYAQLIARAIREGRWIPPTGKEAGETLALSPSRLHYLFRELVNSCRRLQKL